LPIGVCEDPATKEYTVIIDPVAGVAKAKVWFYKGADNAHSLLCEQVFDLWCKKFIRGGSIGYSVQQARQIPPDYEKGIPAGLHLQRVLMLECSVVTTPANQATVQGKSYQETIREILAMPTVCGKELSPVLVKSLSAYAIPNTKTVVGWVPPAAPMGNKVMPAEQVKSVDATVKQIKGLQSCWDTAMPNRYDPTKLQEFVKLATGEGYGTDQIYNYMEYMRIPEQDYPDQSNKRPQRGPAYLKSADADKESKKDEKAFQNPETGQRVERFTVGKEGEAHYVYDRGLNFAGPYESELEAKSKRDELTRIFGDKAYAPLPAVAGTGQRLSRMVKPAGFSTGQEILAFQSGGGDWYWAQHGSVGPVGKRHGPFSSSNEAFDDAQKWVQSYYDEMKSGKSIPANAETAPVPLNEDLSKTDVPPSQWEPGVPQGTGIPSSRQYSCPRLSFLRTNAFCSKGFSSDSLLMTGGCNPSTTSCRTAFNLASASASISAQSLAESNSSPAFHFSYSVIDDLPFKTVKFFRRLSQRANVGKTDARLDVGVFFQSFIGFVWAAVDF